jgi:hypothetical protein
MPTIAKVQANPKMGFCPNKGKRSVHRILQLAPSYSKTLSTISPLKSDHITFLRRVMDVSKTKSLPDKRVNGAFVPRPSRFDVELRL